MLPGRGHRDEYVRRYGLVPTAHCEHGYAHRHEAGYERELHHDQPLEVGADVK